MGRRGKLDPCPDPGWEALAIAVVKQAADDYCTLRAAGGFRRAPNRELKGLLRFFYSDWFGQLCALDPDWLLDQLDRRALREGRGNDETTF